MDRAFVAAFVMVGAIMFFAAGPASAADKPAAEKNSGFSLIIPQLSPCQQAYGEGYQMYWQARNRAAVLVSNRAISVDSYVSVMSSLNGMWQPYLGAMVKLNAANASSPDCRSKTGEFVSRVSGQLAQMPDQASESGAAGTPATSTANGPSAVLPPPPPPPLPPGG
jgi:hypothetical protein